MTLNEYRYLGNIRLVSEQSLNRIIPNDVRLRHTLSNFISVRWPKLTETSHIYFKGNNALYTLKLLLISAFCVIFFIKKYSFLEKSNDLINYLHTSETKTLHTTKKWLTYSVYNVAEFIVVIFKIWKVTVNVAFINVKFMRNVEKQKDLCITIIFSESTASLLNLSAPHLDQLDPENSRIFLISPHRYKSIKGSVSCTELKEEKPSTSQGINSNILSKYQDIVDKKEAEKDSGEAYLQISSNVGLFSKSTCSSNSCMYEGCNSEDSFELLNTKPTDEMEENANNKSQNNLFEARKFLPLPLVTARSKAHENKLNTHSNDIYVSLLDSSSSSTDHMCRICHGGESLDDLLMPCRCRGTVALVHLKCLERWLKDSQHSYCELCMHHYKIERRPRYSILGSIYAYMKEPGPRKKEIMYDLLALTLYTPTAVASTYVLMMMCETLVKANIVKTGTISSHILAFSAVFGMAAIDFTYSSWLLYTCQKHAEAWREWYNNTTTVKVILPAIKMRPIKGKRRSNKERVS